MLKLTNSFCRYFISFVAESKNLNVRKNIQFNKGKTCGATVWYAKSVLLHTIQLLRKKKCYNLKTPLFNSHCNNKDVDMNSQPKNNNVHCGGGKEM